MTRSSSKVLLYTISALLLARSSGFVSFGTTAAARKRNLVVVNSVDNEEAAHALGRRRWLFNFAAGAGNILLSRHAAYAKDELFRPNPLTNSALEQVSLG